MLKINQLNKILRNIVLLLLIGSPLAATPIKDEIRVGVLRHDVRSWLKYSYEKGYDINTEYLLASPCNQFFNLIFNPCPHVGLSLNSHGGTNQIYFGLTWRFDFLQSFFLELSFGGGSHNGRRKRSSSRHKTLGSRLLFRESIALGVQFEDYHSLSLILDHASNANLALPNSGLTGFGLRYGYRFDSILQ